MSQQKTIILFYKSLENLIENMNFIIYTLKHNLISIYSNIYSNSEKANIHFFPKLVGKFGLRGQFYISKDLFFLASSL